MPIVIVNYCIPPLLTLPECVTKWQTNKQTIGGAQEARGSREEEGRGEGSARGSDNEPQEGLHDRRAKEEVARFAETEGRRRAEAPTRGQSQREAPCYIGTDRNKEELRRNERVGADLGMQATARSPQELGKRKVGLGIRSRSQRPRGKSDRLELEIDRLWSFIGSIGSIGSTNSLIETLLTVIMEFTFAININIIWRTDSRAFVAS